MTRFSQTVNTDDITQTLGLTPGHLKKSRRRRLLKILCAVIPVLILVGWWLSRGDEEGVRYVTQPAVQGDLTVTVSATGTLSPIKEVDVGIEVSGTIKTVDVDYNDVVKVGQVLARLDTTKLEQQVLQSTASLESALANVQQAGATVREAESKWKQLNHVRELSGGKMPAQTDLDAAQAALDRARANETSAQAQANQAQATLDVNRTDLSKAVVHSPIDGFVLTREVEPGQTVASSFEAPVLFTLAEDLKEMELLVDVDEADVGSVRDGQEAVFTVDAYPDRKFPAQITKVRYASETVDGVVTYKAVLRVDNADLSLRPGMTATAVITVKKVENALLVPNAALRFAPPAPPADPSGAKRNVMGSLMPHPPRHGQKPQQSATENHSNGKAEIWVLRDNEMKSVTINKGTSDGQFTAVTSGELEAGMELITEMETGK